MEHRLHSHQSLSGQLPDSQPPQVLFSEHRQQASPHLAIRQYRFIADHRFHYTAISALFPP